MSRQVLYDTNDLELVKSRLQVILTCDKKEAARLAKTTFRFETLIVSKIFSNASNALHHKWTSAILGSVPPEAWVEGGHGETHVKPSKEASLRLWSPEEANLHEENMIIGEVRKGVFNELLNAMPAAHKKQYKLMFSWINDPAKATLGLATSPFGSDTLFGHVLIYLEMWLDKQLEESEKLWLVKNTWPKDRCIPPQITRELSSKALEHCKKTLSMWFDEDSASAAKTPNNLLALISANLSANRVLLEFAAKEARGQEAADLAIGILKKLNNKGIIGIPPEIYELDILEAAHHLVYLLKTFFGPRGQFISKESDFKRPMNYSDIRNAVIRSLQLQENYIATRGRRGGPIEARKNHGQSHNLFVFCLTMIGAFYNNSKTDNEFKGKSNSSYAVFPARNNKFEEAENAITLHADELLKQAYGQIYYGNIGSNILADGVRDHAHTASIKRAHVQQLLSFAIKSRSSSVLLALGKRLYEKKENLPLILEN